MSEHYESHRIEDSSIVRERTAAPCRPHKSTTVAERYYHFNDAERRGTVFFRMAGNDWFASVSFTHSNDQFNRSIGRTTSRRKWFSEHVGEQWNNLEYNPYFIDSLYELTYEHAQRAFDHALAIRRAKR